MNKRTGLNHPPVSVKRTRQCSVDGCEREHFGRGYCQKHHYRWSRYGDAEHPLRRGSLSARLERMSKVDGECRVWTASRDRYGYGRITIRPRGVLPAHRVAWEAAHGPIPEGMVIRHKCDNPPCVNVAHLELGTTADNQRDKRERGRSAPATGSENNLSKLTETDIPRIREAASTGSTQRAIARDFGVSPSAISQVVRGVTWSHVA